MKASNLTKSFLTHNGINCFTPSGYINDGRHHSMMHDYLGNVRSVVREDGVILETNSYYPFGAQIHDPAETCDNVQPYKFGGKELERENALDIYDFHARQYDPVLGRFTTPDPLREKYPWLSSYTYAANSPASIIDPTGMEMLMVSGLNSKQYDEIFENLQMLTDDMLNKTLNKDGSYTIGIETQKDKNGKLPIGTALIRTLIKSKRTVAIDYENSKKVFKKDGNRMKVLNEPLKKQINHDYDAMVSVEPHRQGDVLVRNPDTNKTEIETMPTYISLGHELIHTYRFFKGKSKDYKILIPYRYVDTEGHYTTERIPTEEYQTVGFSSTSNRFTENELRKEHNLNQRIKY